jgi:multicomponent Na+:H+ antiporter subunit D
MSVGLLPGLLPGLVDGLLAGLPAADVTAPGSGDFDALIPLPVILPLLGAGLSVVFARMRNVQRAISLVVLLGLVVNNVILLVRVDEATGNAAGGIAVSQAGGWVAPLGISLVVDRLAAMMLVVSSLMLISVIVYAIGQHAEERRFAAFHPVYLILAAGVSASFITGDLFNLFVGFEMMLVASYVLLTLGGRAEQVRSGMSYVVISLIASTFFITALALIYSAAGTVNMAELAERMPELSSGVRTGFSLLLIAVFGIKAGIFPLFFWLPDSYPTASNAVTAVFAGLLTKVGVYAIIRTQLLLFPTDSQQGTVLLIVAGCTMLVGVLGALSQDDLQRILSFHIISHIGYMIMGLGLFTLAGVAGAVFYVVHHIVVKTALFLVAGLVECKSGSDRLSRVGGLVRSAPMISILFALPALSIAGFPPFSGFVAKFALVSAAIEAEQWAIVVVSLLVSLLTMYVMGRIWSSVFWGTPEDGVIAERLKPGATKVPVLMTGATVVVVGLSLALMVFAGPLYDLAERAAASLLDPQSYIDAVLGHSDTAEVGG